MQGLCIPLGEMKNPLAFYALDFGRELISSYGNDDIQQKYISRQANGELIFRDHFKRMMLCGRISKNRLKKYVLFAARKWKK